MGLPYLQHPQGYTNAAELVEAAATIGGFEISVAVHPENHPSSPSIEHEIENFKKKLDLGVTRGISQFFFDPDVFLRFRDRLARAGVYAPVLPGIMPVTNLRGLQKMAGACGASIPRWMIHMFEGLDKDAETRRLVAAVTTAQLCAKLSAEGVQDFHFYTLNRADLALAICRILGCAREGGGMTREQRLAALNAELAKRILILDGSMGAYLQGFGLTSEDFHGQRFADHHMPIKGDSDVLTLTRPEVIAEVHDAYLAAGRGHYQHQHLHGDAGEPG